MIDHVLPLFDYTAKPRFSVHKMRQTKRVKKLHLRIARQNNSGPSISHVLRINKATPILNCYIAQQFRLHHIVDYHLSRLSCPG